MSAPISPRQILAKSSLVSTVGLSARSWGQVPGSNDAIRVAVVGFNGRGRRHIADLLKIQGVRIVALCDADTTVLGRETRRLRDLKHSVEAYTDVRHLLESGEIDAISTATPNHWHALLTIWACQAGKDVYVEKPVSHNVWEGRKAVEAAERYGRIVQAGTQIRSSTGIAEAVDWVRQGNLGRITAARGLCYKRRESIGSVLGRPTPPDSIDYDLWSGPAPVRPLTREKLHYDWHWIWAYGNGDLGNQGIHQMDVARWFLGESKLSPGVLSVGGRLGYKDDGETPNSLVVFHDYPAAPLIFEVRGLPASQRDARMDQYLGVGVGNIIHCEGGLVVVPDYESAVAYDRSGKPIRRFQGAGSHHENFIRAVRSRNSSALTAPLEEGHISSALCHTANISYLLGEKRPGGEIRTALRDQPLLAETFERMQGHLAANGVSLSGDALTLGRLLRMDPDKEEFVADPSANRLLRRAYRAPFFIPERV